MVLVLVSVFNCNLDSDEDEGIKHVYIVLGIINWKMKTYNVS